MTRTHPTIRLFTLGAAAIIAGLLFFSMAAMARADSEVFRVESGTRTSSDQLVWERQLGMHGQGLLCTVEAGETNEPQPSAHPGNRLIISIDGVTILTMPMESGRGGSSNIQKFNVPIGEPGIMRAEIDLGDDGVSSAGFGVAVFQCEGAPPSTSTTSSTSTTTSTSSTTSTSTPQKPPEEPTDTTTTSTTVPASSSTTTTVTTPTTSPSTSIPPEDAPPATVPDTTPIPSGVPTGEGPPPNSPVLPLLVAALAVSAISVGAYRISRRGDDE